MSNKDYNIFFNNYQNTNAATEVTGLIPSGEATIDEWEQYREIFDFEPVDAPELPPQKKTKESL